MQALAQQMAAMQQQRPNIGMCVNCLNRQKLIVVEMVGKLQASGITPGMPEFQQALAAAQMRGEIPPVQAAEVLVQGTGLCSACFTPQKQTNLLIAGANWRPGQ